MGRIVRVTVKIELGFASYNYATVTSTIIPKLYSNAGDYLYIFNTLYYTLHTEHAYCLSYRFLNNVVITTVIEMVELVEILDRRLGKCSVERVRYVINNLLHLVIVKYGDISLVLCISTRLRLVTILSLLVKYLVIFHADPCNKSYISREISIEHPSVGLALLAQLTELMAT